MSGELLRKVKQLGLRLCELKPEPSCQHQRVIIAYSYSSAMELFPNLGFRLPFVRLLKTESMTDSSAAASLSL